MVIMQITARRNVDAMIYKLRIVNDTHINYHSIGNVNGYSTTGMWIGGGYLAQQSDITKFKLWNS